MGKRQKLIDHSKEYIKTLESTLAGTLRPVIPPRDFIQRMRDRIHIPGPRLIVRRLSNWEFVLIIAGGVMSVAVIIAAVARAIFHFFRRRENGLTS